MTHTPAKKIEKPPKYTGLKINLFIGLIFGIFIGRDLGVAHQYCTGYGSGYDKLTVRHTPAVIALSLAWLGLVALTMWYIRSKWSWSGLIYLAIIFLSLAYYICFAFGYVGNNLCFPPF